MEKLILACFFISLAIQFSASQLAKHKPKPKPTPFHDWDYIVFSQRWPITDCTEWQEAGPLHTCNMPPDNKTWSVHGVWPTKTGEDGPYFCDSAIKFDPALLASIESQLEEYWVNIEANTKKYSFWEHEWKKHGTCAVTLPQLNSLLNYFQQGLTWIKQYNMDNILSQSNITPSLNGYTVQNIFDSVKKVLGATPTIQCDVDKSKQTLISEIRICFNKSLDLIDCTGADGVTVADDEPLTNCALKKPVMYLDKVPPETTTTTTTTTTAATKVKKFEVVLLPYYENVPEDAPLVNFYKFALAQRQTNAKI